MDGGYSYAGDADAAQRLLRAQRVRAPKTRRFPVGWAIVSASVVALISVGVSVAMRGVEVNAPGIGQPAATTASILRPEPIAPQAVVTPTLEQAAPAPTPTRGVAPPPPPSPSIAAAASADTIPAGFVRARALSADDALSLTGGVSERGLRVVNAVAGGSADIRRGDVIIGVCDQALDTLAELSAAVAPGACLVVVRDGETMRRNLP